MINEAPKQLTTEEAASYLGLSPRTLEKWRGKTVTGPPYLKLGRRVFYSLEDLEGWRKLQTRRSTSDVEG